MYDNESTVLSKGKGIQEHKEKTKMSFTRGSLLEKIFICVSVEANNLIPSHLHLPRSNLQGLNQLTGESV